jgi:hypothetical protein
MNSFKFGEDIPIGNCGRMQESISSIKHDNLNDKDQEIDDEKCHNFHCDGNKNVDIKVSVHNVQNMHCIYYCYNCEVEQIGTFACTSTRVRQLHATLYLMDYLSRKSFIYGRKQGEL